VGQIPLTLVATGCPNKNATPIFLYNSVHINATVICFTWAVKGCPPVRFAYRRRSERLPIPEIFWFRFWLSNPIQNHSESLHTLHNFKIYEILRLGHQETEKENRFLRTVPNFFIKSSHGLSEKLIDLSHKLFLII
jgi:hypothetical protein